MGQKLKKSSQSGFGVVEAILIIVILGVIAFIGYLAWHNHAKTSDSSANNTSQMGTGNTPTTSDTALVGYKSKTTGASFTYPVDWVKVTPEDLGNNGDAISLRSPSGKVTVTWSSGIGGVGGGPTCDPSQTDEYNEAHIASEPGCTDVVVLSSRSISGAAGLSVVTGYVLEGPSNYYPFIAVLNGDVQGYAGVNSNLYEVFDLNDNDLGSVFAIGGLAMLNPPAPKFSTKTAAINFLKGADAKAAISILASLKVASQK